MSDVEKSGRIRVNVDGCSHKAEWRVVGATVEINSGIGSASVILGALRSAPATVALEKFREMARLANKPAKAWVDRARYSVRDA